MNQIEWEATIEQAAVVAACLIKKDKKYLLVQEGKPSIRGLWNLPAGHVDKGEQIDTAAVREVKEETGFDVQLVKEILLLHEGIGKSVKHIFSANIIGGKIYVDKDEIIDVKWLSFEEIKTKNENNELRNSWVWDVIQKDYLDTL